MMATKQIQPASKKIKKAKTANIRSQDTRLKKYQTFAKDSKSIIIQSLMSELNFPFNGKEFPKVRFLNYIQALDQKSYDESLGKVLTACVNSGVVSKQTLKQWRRKVKEWVKNYGKPETRGGKLVPDDKLESFKEKLIPILYNLPEKNLKLLRKHLLPVFEEMHRSSGKSNQSLNSNICSKHFWSDFLKQNPDIEEIYEAIPHKINDPRLLMSATPIQSYPSQSSFAKNFEHPNPFSDFNHKPAISNINQNISHQSSSTHLSSSCIQDQYLSSPLFDMNFEHNLNDFEQGSIHSIQDFYYPKGTPTFLESPEEAQSLLLSNYQPIHHPNTDFLFPNKGLQSNSAHTHKKLALTIDKIDHLIFYMGQNPSIPLAGTEGVYRVTKHQYHPQTLPADYQQNTLEVGLCRSSKSQAIIEPDPNVYQRQCFFEFYQGNFNKLP